MSPGDVKEFKEELKDFRQVFPEYADKTLYGALAYINVSGHSDKMAEKQVSS